ncbi:kinase-like protein [Coniochaeta ligniaria NRRL 30616]|uniref:non-specific serine/threonine protein kinase n=1 Tax=Coniochaeta ligniaria NRRL 30616 TaxID=1408157 RepID=A0A1J7JV82_9PEZI|nr:kinase-like protein [Coniochaeta ligniaria NRRL 30616]
MDNSGNRLYLNFGANGDRLQANDRTAYPTTPSTFPQPVFPGAPGQSQTTAGGGQSAPQQQPYTSGYAPQGYFMQAQYAAPQYQTSVQDYGAPAGQNQPAAYGQARSNTPGTSNDPNTGLAHQFSHQNLGGAARGAPYAPRGPSPSQRPRTAGAPAQQSSYSSYLNPPVPTQPAPRLEFQQAPERNPDKYGPNAHNNQKKCSQLAADFFKDSVKRARERNQRQSEMEQKLSETTDPRRRESIWSTGGRKEGSYLRFLRTKDKPENYNTIKIIGKGAFGEVKLVQKRADNKVYAMKSLVKTEMFKKDQLAHVRAERDILAESDSPWVVKLYTTFQDSNFLYMLMEFLPGGDLMTMLIKYEIFSEDITRFYIAEIVLAIEAVHQLGFIHRDIKPDNILLDRGGHVKLTDFGLSTGFHKLHDNNYYQQLLKGKSSRPRGDRNSIAIDQINLTVSNRGVINDWRRSRRLMAYSTVGTPDYIAPEIFTQNGYTFDCDWWSLGTIMFECLIGWPPFCAEDSHDTYRKIVNWRQSLYFPDDIPLGAEAENLIRSLICNTENRLGRGGAHEIKSHSFFRGVEFDSLRRIRAPFEPRLTSAIDTTYFPTDEIDQTDNATLLRAAQQARGTPGGQVPTAQEESPEMSLPFIGYTFKRFDNNFR